MGLKIHGVDITDEVLGRKVMIVKAQVPGTIKQAKVKGTLKTGRPVATALREAAEAVRKARTEMFNKIREASELGLEFDMDRVCFDSSEEFTYTPQEEKY